MIGTTDGFLSDKSIRKLNDSVNTTLSMTPNPIFIGGGNFCLSNPESGSPVFSCTGQTGLQMADVKTDNISSTEFGKLFFEFKPRFIALAYRYVRDRETAEDLVSDSFMTFWEMHETLPADINVPAYILTSVKNRCLNHLNAQIRHRRAEQDMHSTLTRRLQADVRSLSACDPDLLFSEEIRAILKQAVRKMPKMTRSVFLLSRIRNMTYSEIAAELGISVSHVNFEIRRALNLMRSELKDYLPAVLITLILSSRW